MSQSQDSTLRNVYSQSSQTQGTGGAGGGGGDGGGGGAGSQEDDPNNNRGGVVLVDYEREKELFAKFLREHTIVVSEQSNADSEDSDDDDVMWEPVGLDELDGRNNNNRRRTMPCYAQHLQRIVNRDFYGTERVFIVEVPLQELHDFGQDELAKRATENTLRYEEVFSQVVDQVLETLTQHGADENEDDDDENGAAPPDSVELLHRHRMQQQQAREEQRQQQQAADAHNHYAGNDNQQGNAGDNDPNHNGGGDINNNPRNPSTNTTEALPPQLLRRYELRILPLGRQGALPPFDKQYNDPRRKDAKPPNAVSLRQVRSNAMGRLVTLQGMIVRTSDVKPQTVVATYTCDACGAEIYQPTPHQREFLPPKACPSTTCQSRSTGGAYTLQLQTRGSKFIKFQELKLQELPSQVPMGHVPRSLTVHCRGELTRQAAPGDVVTVDGIFLPQRLAESGFKAMKAGLVSLTYLHATNLCCHKKSYDDNNLDHEQMSVGERAVLNAAVDKVAQSDDPVGRLSSSIAPEIFGHEDVKRALLLQLVGGVTRSLPDGMRIRGDLNLCLMGDPGVAKSQLLKHVASIAPRGVYTTGKGSSGVGLTAAVTKDMATGEMALEGGALVLADRGICCIDEFDKMDEADRTAIHEVMEQGQVSIAKAGIVATLNARSAVLAAANPLYSRYNRNKSLSENIALPNSLLSRFDLLFLILDVANVERDMALARHVTLVHQNEGLEKSSPSKEAEDSDSDEEMEDGTNQDNQRTNSNTEAEDDANKPVTPQVLREYIYRARRHQPTVPAEVAPYIVEAYVSLRLQDKRPGGKIKGNDQTAMTARQLLSILRLSQALARLRFSDLVARQDVDEAIRLTHMSKASLEDNNGTNNSDGNEPTFREDVTSRIFQVLREYLASTATDNQEIDLNTAEAMVLRKGFTAQQFQTCLEEYEALKVIQINQTRTHVYFL